MQGIEIPISGNLAPLLAAISEMRAEFTKVGNDIRAALGPARQAGAQLGASMRNAATGATSAQTSFKGMVGTLSNAGMVIANVAAGAKGIRSAFNFLRSLPAGWQRVAKAAMITGVAIVGIVGAVKVVKGALRGLLGIASGVWNTIRSGAANAARSVKGVFSGIASAIPGGGLLGPLAGVAGVAGSIALLFASVKSGLGLAGELERTGIALEALTGSGAGAKQVLDEMRASWLRTGVAIEDQAGTIQKFLALGFSQGDALKLQKNILDVAGAVGMSTSEAALLGSALAQVKAKGVVSMEELRQQIAEKGVPVIEALADKLGVAQGALIAMVSEGKVPAQTLIDLFLNMEGSFGKFIGGANRMGATFLGMLGRLRGAWRLLLADFAAPIADSLKPLISSALGLVERFRAQAVAAGKAVGDALFAAFALVKSGKTFDLLRAGFAVAITGAMDLLMRGLRGAVAFLATSLPPIFEVAMSKFRDPRFWQGVSQFVSGVGQTLAAEIRSAFPGANTGKIAQQREIAGLNQEAGSLLMGLAGRGSDLGAIIADALIEGGKAAAEAMGGPVSQSFLEARQRMQDLLGSVREEVARLRAGAAVPPPGKGAGGKPSGAADKPAASSGRLMTLTTELTRVGGSRFGMTFSPMITEQKRATSLLTRIEKNTRAGRVPAIV